MVECTQCGGSGRMPAADEDDAARGIDDTCYHCAGSGRISKDIATADREVGLIEEAAFRDESAVQRESDGDDGYYDPGSGVSSYDYFTQNCNVRADGYIAALRSAHPDVRSTVLGRLRLRPNRYFHDILKDAEVEVDERNAAAWAAHQVWFNETLQVCGAAVAANRMAHRILEDVQDIRRASLNDAARCDLEAARRLIERILR